VPRGGRRRSAGTAVPVDHAGLQLLRPKGETQAYTLTALTGDAGGLQVHPRRLYARAVSEWRDPPEWMRDLVEGAWGAPEWAAWAEVWLPRLEAHGVTPDNLRPLGDPARPTWIEAQTPEGASCSGLIDWDAGEGVLHGLKRLVRDLDATGSA
jgi:hypothetical protein